MALIVNSCFISILLLLFSVSSLHVSFAALWRWRWFQYFYPISIFFALLALCLSYITIYTYMRYKRAQIFNYFYSFPCLRDWLKILTKYIPIFIYHKYVYFTCARIRKNKMQIEKVKYNLLIIYATNLNIRCTITNIIWYNCCRYSHIGSDSSRLSSFLLYVYKYFVIKI